ADRPAGRGHGGEGGKADSEPLQPCGGDHERGVRLLERIKRVRTGRKATVGRAGPWRRSVSDSWPKSVLSAMPFGPSVHCEASDTGGPAGGRTSTASSAVA